MLVSSPSGSAMPLWAAQSYRGSINCEAPSPSVSGSYDHLALSPEPVGDRRFQLELVSRLSREVRAIASTGDIQALHRRVSGGSYHPDAMETAARMLLMKGADPA
ncbi:MAG: hypothetical protein RR295_10120, partial [Oscillospiraceae bacterium]